MTRANPKRFSSLASGVIAAFIFCCDSVLAIPLHDLDPGVEWRVGEINIAGNERFGGGELKAILSTKERPWYAPWQRRPVFEPGVFSADLEQLKRFYESKGYYGASVSYDLIAEEKSDRVTVNIDIKEGEPVKVADISVEVIGAPELEGDLRSLATELPLREGEVFSEEAYQQSEAKIREYLYDRGRARVQIERQAEVVLDQRQAKVFYRVQPGPPSVFGETAVVGLKDVAPEIVLRERPYEQGDLFSGKPLRDLERNLRQLDLFSQIQISLQPSPANPAVVPIEIRVEERPPREILVGIGYGTEEQLRGQLRWRHNNRLGDGRKLDIGAKVSFIAREINAAFLQPHFLSPKNRFLLNFGPKQFEEPGFDLNMLRLQPRLERKFTENVTGFINYRLDYDQLSGVERATREALEEFTRSGLLSGLSLGVNWRRVDNLLDPTRGWMLSFSSEQVGGFLGGKFDFFKLLGEGATFHPITAKTGFATKLRIGFAEPFNGSKEVPLFERFYAGGSGSVRGYGRHRLGPLSAADDPIGGRSLFEAGIELRRQFTETIGGAIFLDFGQVSPRSFDLPIDDLKFGAGFGVRYSTPVGPVRVDLGFPFSPPKGDRSWQIYVNIGPTF